MVKELEIVSHDADFPETAPAANPVFFRTYSRRTDSGRETWSQVCARAIAGLVELGSLDRQEADLLERMMRSLLSLPSGRWLWVGGTPWLSVPENFSGAYNCTSTSVVDWNAFGLMMGLAMMGCGTGAILESQFIDCLPPIRNQLRVKTVGAIGTVAAEERREETEVRIENSDRVRIVVGDSRSGWVQAYQAILELSADERLERDVEIAIDLSHVRPAGEVLKGFGGVANPVKLPELFGRLAKILERAIARKLSAEECCLLVDEAAATIVAGNIRRCLPEYALVHTSSGLVPIKDIRVGDRVQTPLGFRRVVDIFERGIQDVRDIETNGTYPQATENHRIAVLTSARGDYIWKRVGDLEVGDRLLHSTEIVPGYPTKLPKDTTAKRPVKSRTAKEISIPELTTDVAWLIGFTHGDGYVSLGQNKHNKPYGAITWATDTGIAAEIEEKLNQCLACFGVTAKRKDIEGENTVRFTCSSIRLTEYFFLHIKRSQESLTIPDFILRGAIEIRAAYLAGLVDSDGAINNRPPQVVCTVYPDFVRQISSLLSSLGIAGRIKTTAPQKASWRTRYHLTIPAFKREYNQIIAPHSVKGSLKVGLKMYGFTLPGWMMRESYSYSEMQGMGFQGTVKVDSNYERYRSESDLDIDIPVTFKGLGQVRAVPTYDIEVEDAHCFYCDGYLTHNSAGIRQFDSNSPLLKQNLWQPDENGVWRIDPNRDALRMANHTRVYHQKPSEPECIEAVRSQYYSGEGAIQWSGEAIARANADLLTDPTAKREFIAAYEQGKGEAFLKSLLGRESADAEIEHRLSRYGLNPCVTADTWVHTEHGARQVKDLIGQQVAVYVNGELFSTTAEGFFFTGEQPVLRLTSREGYAIELTGGHKVLKVTCQTYKKQYSEWVEAQTLQPGDRILIHNHRHLQPWSGQGTRTEGWLLGNFVGDGCYSINETSYSCLARLQVRTQVPHIGATASPLSLLNKGGTKGGMGDRQAKMAQRAADAIAESTGSRLAIVARKNGYARVGEAALYKLADRFGLRHGHKMISPAIEEASYEFYQGFLAGLFDADGSVQGNQEQGISVRLAQGDWALLQAAQRMLLRLGVASSLYQNCRPEMERLLPDGEGGHQLYSCEAQHELVIAQDNLGIFAEYIGFDDPDKQEKLDSLLANYKHKLNRERFAVTIQSLEEIGSRPVYDCTVPQVARFDANGFVAHNCGEIIGREFHCNLSEIHLNQIDPRDRRTQEEAFRAGGLSVAILLNHTFLEPRYQYSRLIDPIVGVSFTGLFDFFVQAFGVDWLRWWEQGRPESDRGLAYKQQEREYLEMWRSWVEATVWDYCDRRGIKRPNRCTTVQPSGTKSLLTGASPGWHPPKAVRFIRRITFRRNDPVALACIDYGYNVIPSQADKDERGRLLDDPFDPRVTEWLVEIPVAVSWADLPGADAIDISQFSALAQMDFYLQVQQHYTTHNTSATIELREGEIEALGKRIYEAIRNDEGYISAALLSRFDDHQSFPRLPFEPVDRATYEQLTGAVEERRKTDNFATALQRYDRGEMLESGPAGCDSDKCWLPESLPEN